MGNETYFGTRAWFWLAVEIWNIYLAPRFFILGVLGGL